MRLLLGMKSHPFLNFTIIVQVVPLFATLNKFHSAIKDERNHLVKEIIWRKACLLTGNLIMESGVIGRQIFLKCYFPHFDDHIVVDRKNYQGNISNKRYPRLGASPKISSFKKSRGP